MDKMNKLYEKNGILFATIWIVVYVVGLSLADGFSRTIGVEKSVSLVLCLILTLTAAGWIKKNNYLEKYGLCRPCVPMREMLYYVPLVVIATINVWYGFAMNMSPLESLLYVVSMLLVGFLEEIIFRGFLFVEMAKDNVKTAIIVSSVTFGIGHIVNLINGSGADLFSNLLQVVYAIAAGFMFTIIFYKTKSLWPCIITHSVINASSAFANEVAASPLLQIGTAAVLTVVSLGYGIYILKKQGNFARNHEEIPSKSI